MLFAFSMRRIFGLAPLLLFIGCVEGLKYFLTVGFEFQLGGTAVSLSSAIYYPATLTIFLMIYVREDAALARQLIWSLMFANIGLSLIMGLVWFDQRTDDSVIALQVNLWRIAVGTVLLFAGALAVLLLHNRLQGWGVPSLLRWWLPLSLVAALDTVLYIGLTSAWVEVALPTTGWTMLAKALALLGYVGMMWGYLYLFERDSLSPLERRETDGDLLALLSYRERFVRLQREVITDGLTGAYNRRHLDAWLPEELRTMRLRGQTLALLMLDIDHFKTINDRYGHQLGDAALQHFVRAVQSILRRGDTLFRYGGEEFCVVLSAVSRDVAIELAQRTQAELRRLPTLIGGHSLTLTCTIGIAMFPDDGQSAKSLIAVADQRLYRGKNNGRDCCIAEG